jgi:hypothetical protein
MASKAEPAPEILALLDTLPPSTRALTLAVREVVLASLPDVAEVPDVKARVIGYGYGVAYKDMIATIILSKSGVKIGLVRGASLPDPAGLLEGAGKVHRHVAFADISQVSRPGVKSLLHASLAAWRKRSGADSAG